MTEATPPPMRIAAELHYSAALRGLGRLDDAWASVNTASDLLESDSSMGLSLRIRLGAKIALHMGLLQYHRGDYDSAASQLRVASGLASAQLHPSEQVECFGGLALVQYSLGNFDRATEFVDRARAAAGDSGLAEGRFGAAALITELLVSVEQGRLDDAERLAVGVATASTRSDWEPLGLYSRAAISIISEKYVEGLDLLRLCLKSYSSWQPPGTIVTMSEGLRATILLRLGETDSAWDILGSITPTQNHSNCPGRFLAHLRFSTGDVQGALRALQECEALGDAHSSRTLVDVLLIKAAATHQLASYAVSDISFDRAMLLAAGNQMSTPFRLVPNSVMRAMIQRGRQRAQPAAVQELFDTINDSGTIVGGMDWALLSDRERDIVRAFTAGLGVSDIAETLFISVNTVKTHMKSIYRKLGVSSRADAIKRARALGLHLEITPGSPPNHPR